MHILSGVRLGFNSPLHRFKSTSYGDFPQMDRQSNLALVVKKLRLIASSIQLSAAISVLCMLISLPAAYKAWNDNVMAASEARSAHEASISAKESAASARNLVQEQKEQNRILSEQKDELRRAASAADQLINTLREEGNNQRRASLSIIGSKIQQISPYKPIVVNFLARNNGKDDPYKISMASNFYFTEEQEPGFSQYPACQGSQYRFDYISQFASGDFVSTSRQPPSMQDSKLYNDGKYKMVAWATLCYTDGLGNFYATNACFVYSANGESTGCRS